MTMERKQELVEHIENLFANSTYSSCSFFDNCLAVIRGGRVSFGLKVIKQGAAAIYELNDGKVTEIRY